MRQSTKWILFLLLALAVGLGVVPPLLESHQWVALTVSEADNLVSIINPANVESQLPLQIWLTSINVSWVGRSEIVESLFSLSFVILTLVSTYKLSQYLAPRRGVGSTALFVLMSMAAFITVSSIDVGAQAIAAGAVIFAIWQGVVAVGGGGIGVGDGYSSRRAFERFRFMPHLGFAVGLTLSMWAMGIYAVGMVLIATLIYMFASRRIKWIVSARFLLVVAIFALLALPLLWMPYAAFGWQGVRQVIYAQLLPVECTFGVRGASGALFCGLSLLWLALPWSCLILYFAISSLVKRQIETLHYVTLIASIVIIAILAFCGLRLVMLTPLLPLLAIFLADKLLAIEVRTPLMRGVAVTQKIVVALIVALAAVANYYCFPFERIWFAVVYGILLVVLGYALFRPWLHVRTIIAYSVAASAVLFIGLNANFYPQLIKSQVQTTKKANPVPVEAKIPIADSTDTIVVRQDKIPIES